MAQKSAFAVCPQCNGRSLRLSEPKNWKERLRTWFGVSQFRCRQCNHRFETAVVTALDWRYARCPQCYRFELSTWSTQYYHPTWFTQLLLNLGGTPYRCEFCRCNFASFRACKERFSWRRQRAEAREANRQPSVASSKAD
jgi:hypothetical protein